MKLETRRVVGVICWLSLFRLLWAFPLRWPLVLGSRQELNVTANCSFVYIEFFCNGAVRFSRPDAARYKLAALARGQSAHDRAHCPHSMRRRALAGLVA